jgi:Icc protein
MMQILQITDPHLYGSAAGRLRGVETDSSLHAVLDDAFARVPDYAAVLVTGDLVQDDGSGYLRFRSILGNLEKPVLCIPGNHDEPEAMRRELNVAPFQICGTHEAEGWQFIMLDSYDPGHVGGRLTPNELARLDSALAASPKHAMVCMHHHPITMGSRWLDTVGLTEPEAFWRVIDSHAQVRAVVWGHVHQAYDGRRGDVRLFATPSTGAQFLPKSDRYAVDTRPPAYRHFNLLADGRIDTAVHWIESLPMRQSLAR